MQVLLCVPSKQYYSLLNNTLRLSFSILSTIFLECIIENYPHVYARVSKGLPWIKEIVCDKIGGDFCPSLSVSQVDTQDDDDYYDYYYYYSKSAKAKSAKAKSSISKSYKESDTKSSKSKSAKSTEAYYKDCLKALKAASKSGKAGSSKAEKSPKAEKEAGSGKAEKEPPATGAPTSQRTGAPTGNPTSQPTGTPTVNPTSQPTGVPTGNPTSQPTGAPTGKPTPQLPGDDCSCSPLVYNFILNLDANCETDDLGDLPGIAETVCFLGTPMNEDSRRLTSSNASNGLRLLEQQLTIAMEVEGEEALSAEEAARLLDEDIVITSVQFIEFSINFTPIKQSTILPGDDDTLNDGDIVTFTSIANDLAFGVPIEDQLDTLPGGLQVTVTVQEIADGESFTVVNVVQWTYTNVCGVEPLVGGESIGWITTVSHDSYSST